MQMYEKNIEKCSDLKLKKVLLRLKKYQEYCLLDNGDLSSYVKVFESIGKMPNQLKEWLKIFDGGALFSVSMFFADIQKGLKNKILTFAEINSKEFRLQNEIPDDIVCFAMTNYGNYYCFAQDEDIDYIYEWDAEECDLVEKWDDFATWLEDRINDAESDIKDGLLFPITTE